MSVAATSSTQLHRAYTLAGGFLHLQAHVATSAFDSVDNADATWCHPNTRRAVLQDIFDWIFLAASQIQWIFWLNGAAGAGKSDIARSIVQHCLKNGIPVARFFFFRSDLTRNNIQPVVATLVDQLIRTVPDLYPIVIPVINADPLIFTKSLDTQFKSLVFDPLRQLKNSSISKTTLLLMFDGVDECNDHDKQKSLIRIVSDFVSTRDYPMIVLFASRREPQLNAAFRHPMFTDILRGISLDNDYTADDDIRLFVNRSFAQIKNTHHLSHTLDSEWPSRNNVEMIVTQSSGQFIFASVSMNFISTPHKNPVSQLNIVLGLRPIETSNPFAQLDALYMHIFSNVESKEVTFLVLAWALFSVSGSLEISRCGNMLSMDVSDVYAALAPLTSVLRCTDGEIHFLHASLPDFLCDQTRSGEYYMDKVTWCNRIASSSIQRTALLDEGMTSAQALVRFCNNQFQIVLRV